MERFWDSRTQEDPYYYVDNRLQYGAPDTARFWEHGERDLDTLLAAVGASIEADDAVVEIGCGLGRLTRPLSERASSVTAVDVSSEMLRHARELNAGLANVHWVHGDGTTLSGVADASADICLSHVVFQHLPSPGLTLGYVAEMGRVLRGGGRAVFGFSNDGTVHHVRRRGTLGATRRRLGELVGRAPRGECDPAWVGSAVELRDLSKTAAGAGLSIQRLANEGTQYCVALLRRQD